MNFSSSPFFMNVIPSGFLYPDAIFATYIVLAIPTLTVSPVCSFTFAFIFFAISKGGPKSFSVPVRSINASSIDI